MAVFLVLKKQLTVAYHVFHEKSSMILRQSYGENDNKIVKKHRNL